MAKTTRLPILTKTMRELMFASGGRCAMTDCGLSLISPTGGWVGTVAHIVGAEENGPRGQSPLTPEQRRGFDNLILMCATHGREVDAPETGEARFPVPMLETMKRIHETKISEAVENAISEDTTGLRKATGLLDTLLRPANAATSGAGLGEALDVTDDARAASLMLELEFVRSRLQGLSQPALETLSQLLGLWTIGCRSTDVGYRFGDWTTSQASVPFEIVTNRIARHREEEFEFSSRELRSHDLLSIQVDDDARTADYVLVSPWNFKERYRNQTIWTDFWVAAAEFLWAAHGVLVQDWVLGLDFSVFDRLAPADRDVDWR